MAEIFDLLPSVHAVLGRRTPARTLARLALAAARHADEGGEVAFPGDADPEAPQAPILFRSDRDGSQGGAADAAPPSPDAPSRALAEAPFPVAPVRAAGGRLHLA